MKRFLAYILFFVAFFSLGATTYKVSDVPNVHVQNRTRYLSNPDGIISPEAQVHIDSLFSQIWRETSVEAVCVVVDDIDPQDYDTFATDLFTAWGVGKKDNDNGLLILVVKDLRKAVIRTGYGVEGALPDIISSRILREQMFPQFKEGDYDEGVYNGVKRIYDVLSDPSLRDELMSKNQNDAGEEVNFREEVLPALVGWSILLTVLMTAYVIFSYSSLRKKSRKVKYEQLKNNGFGALVATFLGFGPPVIAYAINKYFMSKVRKESPVCAHCHVPKVMMPQKEGIMRLTPVQITESNIGSVEYDAWQCPKCGDVEVIEYPGSRKFEACPYCGARAEAFVGDDVLKNPTYYSQGQGVHRYVCRHCGKMMAVAFIIPMLVRHVSSGGSGGFGGGGGFSGGSFGGGMTGGGGASGGW